MAQKDYASLLYGSKEMITILKNPLKVGTSGTPLIGYSAHRNNSITTPAKLSSVAAAMELILNNKVKTLESDNCIFVEMKTSSDTLYAICQNDYKTQWFQKDGRSKYSIAPHILMLLKNKKNHEIHQPYNDCIDDYMAFGYCSLENLLLLCDSFYYGYAKTNPNFEVEEHAFSLDTIKMAYKAGELKKYDGLRLPELVKGIKPIDEKETKDEPTVSITYGDVFQKCKEGNYLCSYSWSTEQQQNIPSLQFLEGFIPPKKFFSLVNKFNYRISNYLDTMKTTTDFAKVLGKHPINITLLGKPGTGKTTIAYALASTFGLPIYSITHDKSTDVDEYEGKDKIVDGKIQSVPTEFLKAFKEGGVVVLEEINLADPAITMGALGQAIEFPYILKENGYKIVKRHPLCIIISTMNVGTYGSKTLSQALSSRHKQKYVIDDPEKAIAIDILASEGYKKKDCTWVYERYVSVMKYLQETNNEDICLNVSFRQCIGALECIEEGDSRKEAIENTIIGAISEVSLELAKEVYEAVIENIPD